MRRLIRLVARSISLPTSSSVLLLLLLRKRAASALMVVSGLRRSWAMTPRRSSRAWVACLAAR